MVYRFYNAPFFFSSRRRHTSSLRDWRSDVCSSDLRGGQPRGAHVRDHQGPAGNGCGDHHGRTAGGTVEVMTEEPYRWLEAIGNRREYVREQLKGGSPVFGASLPEGILLLGIGTGHSKVFELFDRHALAGLGHPADIEKIRQAAIDAAHLEAFNRAPEDVSLR